MTITLTREEAQQVLDALYSMSGTEFLCQAAHHPKKDMHKSGEVCPVAARYMEARETLRARLSAPEPEPVAWFTEDHREDKSATTYSKKMAERWKEKGWPVTPLYTTPPQREWQGLTDEEIEAGFMANICCDDLVVYEHVASAIEAKLKEKNHE